MRAIRMLSTRLTTTLARVLLFAPILGILGLGPACFAQGRPCALLKGISFPAAAAQELAAQGEDPGLATRGSVVYSAKLATSQGVRFCKVLGEVRSVDPAAQPIRFEVNLPETWNGKAVHYGGGGFDGALSIANGLRVPEVGVKTAPTPLQQGYATFGSDSGHHHHYLLIPDEYNELKARFALNPEQLHNYAKLQLKKTHDAAVAVISTRYGMQPRRMFFLGGSTGGREAYFVTQLWPADYDGVLGAYAGWNQVELDLQLIRVTQAEYRKAEKSDKTTRGWLPKSATRLVARKVMDACDGLDGVRDGIVSDPSACHFELKTLACAAGVNGKQCLTPGQLRTFETFATEQRTAMPLDHGVQSIAGYNVTRGADLTGSMGLLAHPFHQPAYPFGSFYYQIGSGVLRFFLTKDEHFDLFTFDVAAGGKFGDQLLPGSVASDASNADLTPFQAHGGKFLMVHGTADTTIPTGASEQFYGMLEARMGKPAVQQFVRFYEVPGFGHGHGPFDAGFDALGVLDRWVETGVAPAGLVAVDNNKGAHRARPLCEYPAWPKYVGGDVSAAGSFACVE